MSKRPEGANVEVVEQDYDALGRILHTLHPIPTEASEQQMLRGLCERTLQFENHFLTVYKNYLQKSGQSL